MTCPHADACGGCSLLHHSYAQQLSLKESALRTLLGSAVPARAWQRGELFLPVPYPGAEPDHFRQKVSFVFAAAPGGRGLAMGHYERGSQRVVPVQECSVHSARGNRIAFGLYEHLARAGVTPAGASLSGVLRHLLVRTSLDEREAVAMLVVTRNDKSLRRPVRALLESVDRPDGFFVNVNARPGPYMVGDQTIRIWGHGHVRETVGGITYRVSPTAFFQTNVAAAQELQRHVVASVDGATHVLDIYCGSGLFSLPLARSGLHVTGVEENRQAIRDAEANAASNNIQQGRIRFLAGRAEDLMGRLIPPTWDAIILDPPRQGCTPRVVDAVFGQIAPPHVTYVSCNPGALASELPSILRRGYTVASVRAVDMFPHTEHLEAVVQFTRAGRSG